MKLQGTFILAALLAASSAGAQPQTNAPPESATLTVQKPRVHWLAPLKPVKAKRNLRPIAGLDSRAWTTVVGWHPGRSAFADAETHEGQLVLFSVDLGPVR